MFFIFSFLVPGSGPEFSDHLSYVTLISFSLERSLNPGLTVLCSYRYFPGVLFHRSTHSALYDIHLDVHCIRAPVGHCFITSDLVPAHKER